MNLTHNQSNQVNREAPCSTRVLGFDPGLGGALAMVTGAGQLISVWDMPISDGLVCPLMLDGLLDEVRPDLVVIERAGSRFNGVKLGIAFGEVYSLVRVRSIPIKIVAPITWKKEFGLSSEKKLSLEMCLKLWPEHESLFRRAQDHDRAEAALIARWGAAHLGELLMNNQNQNRMPSLAMPAEIASARSRRSPFAARPAKSSSRAVPAPQSTLVASLCKVLSERSTPATIREIMDHLSYVDGISFRHAKSRHRLLCALEADVFKREIVRGMRMWTLRRTKEWGSI